MLVHRTEPVPHFSKGSKEGPRKEGVKRAPTWIAKKLGKKTDELGAKKVKDRVAQPMFASLALTSNRASDLGGGKGVIRFDPDVLGWLIKI